MKRQSNLAFNREFPKLSGLSGIPRDHPAFIQRDKDNPFDPDAVGVWLAGHTPVLGCVRELRIPYGWLYRKDANRPDVLKKLDRTGEPIACHIE